MTPDFSQFETKAGVHFSNKNLLKQAFTHRSYINENRTAGLEHNERLEFLGDAVLELIATEYLFRKFPDKPEGDLTAYRSALVNSNTLASVATTLGINDFMLLSRGESKDTGRARQYILADALEALIGAVHLDQGYEAATAFVNTHILHLIEDIVKSRTWIDAKSQFQERAQEKAGVTPLYKTLKETGPDHDKHFVVGVFVGREQIVTGEGKSKQEAEQNAAEKALEAKGWAV